MLERYKIGVKYMVKGAFAFSLMGMCIKLASPQIPIIEILFFRSIIGFCFILPFVQKKTNNLWGNRPALLILRSLFGFLALYCFFYAIARLYLANAVMLNYTSPIFITLLAGPILKERITPLMGVLIGISFLGVFLVVGPTTEFGIHVSLIGILSGFLAASAYMTIRFLRRSDSAYTIIFYFTSISSLLSLVLMLPDFVFPDFQSICFLLGVGVFAHFGQLFMTQAYINAPASVIANYAYLTVAFSAIIGILFFKEPLLWPTIFGIGLIVASGILLSKLKTQKTGSDSEAQ